jgi:hypothetical protein
MADDKKIPIRQRKAIMIRPDQNLLAAMEATADMVGISFNRLPLDIIETSGRLGSEKAAGTRAELNDAVSKVEAAVRKLRAAMS